VGFVDDAMIDHAAFGGAARVYLTPRVAIGPEVAYLQGPGPDRDLMVTGNLTFDVLGPRNGRPSRVTPFLTVGGGYERHSDRFGPITFSSSEGAFTGGGGVRVWLSDRAFAVVEARMGWEPHFRVTGGIGVALRELRTFRVRGSEFGVRRSGVRTLNSNHERRPPNIDLRTVWI
jgi:hypothetical protein